LRGRAPAWLLAAVLLLLTGCTLQPDVSQAAPNGRVGTSAPPLAGQNVEGIALKIDFHQSRTVLVFWAAWCGPCRNEQPWLDALATQYADRGVQFYGVDMLDHDRALARAFRAEFKVSYPSLYDSDGLAAAAYEVDSPPSLVLVDQHGMVVARYPGEASQAQLQKLIDQKLLD
jgi:thiol-disulfide isomerase/thioredoxin